VSLTKGEVGKVIRVSSGGYDMSSNTELEIVFTLPDDTSVTKASADGVVIGSGVTDPDLGVLAANEYVEYPTEAGFLSQASIVPNDWNAYIKYTNTTPTPDDIFIGACVAFTVSDVTCS